MAREAAEPATCIYCELSRKMSKEHVLGEWLLGVVPHDTADHTRSAATINRLQPEAGMPKVASYHQGSVGTRKLRRVCLVCNTGWMSSIQEQAKPTLAALIHGTWENLEASAQILTLWTAMTVMNIDALQGTGGAVSQVERRFLAEHSAVPNGWCIWAARRSGGGGMGYYHRPMTVADLGSQDTSGLHRNLQITTIELGQLVLQSVSDPNRFFEFDPVEIGSGLGLVTLHPTVSPDWAVAPILTNEHMPVLINGLAQRFMDLLRP